MRNLYISAAIIMLLIAVGTIVWMRQRLKIETARNDALMAEASGLKCRIDESNGDVARLESKLQGLLSNRFALIDSLCQTYYESQGTKAERKAIVDKVKYEIESVRSDAFPKWSRPSTTAATTCSQRFATHIPTSKATITNCWFIFSRPVYSHHKPAYRRVGRCDIQAQVKAQIANKRVGSALLPEHYGGILTHGQTFPKAHRIHH